MRILLTGDPASGFIRDYASNLRKYGPAGIRIDLFSTMTPGAFVARPFFDRVFCYPHLGIYKHFKQSRFVVRLIWLFFFILRNGRKYDHIHIHYLLIDFAFLSPLFSLLGYRPVITVFGSDLLRISPSRKKALTGIIRHARLLTFANQEIRDRVCSYYRIDPSKTRICRFGLPPLDHIRDLDVQPPDALRYQLGLPEGKTVICVGSNFNSNQQHVKIMKSLAENEPLAGMTERLHFVFPLTYGTETGYKQTLLKLLDNFPFSRTVLTEFLSDADNAALRRTCDIMVQLQEYDQLSGAMQEHLYAGNVVITGKWLPYLTFKERGVYFIEIDDVGQVGQAVHHAVVNLAAEKEKCRNNPRAIYDLSSWEANIHSWISLYR